MHHHNLWAPWRMAYIRQLEHSAEEAADGSTVGDASADETCFLCQAAEVTAGTEQANERLVLLRDERGTLLLNRYPYTNGHLLVTTLEHVADMGDLTSSKRGGLMDLVVVAQELLRIALAPQGFNIGINIGRCAGAGVPGHLHVHVVPRWAGDTNFMQTVGDVRVIPEALKDNFECLYKALGAVVDGQVK